MELPDKPLLPDIVWPSTLTTSTNDLVSQFFEPALQRSIRYDRGVGFFSSGWLRVNAAGMVAFAANAGRARWVTSPILSPADWEALRTGDEARSDSILREALVRNLADLVQSLAHDTVSALAWMVADEILDFKLALPRGHLENGEFHDKFGIFTDREGNRISFNGSYNDSIQGLLNYESIKVFNSWNAAFAPLVESDAKRFDNLWENKDPNLRTYNLPEAAKEQILKLRVGDRPYPPPKHPLSPSGQQERFPLWQHQKDAFAAFLEARRGIVEMATGTGKTRLALALCDQLTKTKQVETIIVAADGTDLLEQWHKQLLGLLRDLSPRWILARQFGDHRERDRFTLDPRRSVLLTSRHFLPSALQRLRPEQREKTILIHDEVHRLGSPSNRDSLSGLSESIGFRLGLSATPEREYDADGNSFVENHIGPVVYRFGLEDAIRSGVLCPFNYFPIHYEPNEEDRERIQKVYAQKAARSREGRPMTQEEVWIEIAKVHKTSKAKLPPFTSFITEHPQLLENCIVFVETKEYGESVLSIIHRFHHEFHTYFADEESERLQQFARGDIECLLTCHRLSEGIDIRSLKTVILFSSARARLETIQRMGRCLRTDPNNPTKIANVVDFSRIDGAANADTEREEWLTALSTIRPEIQT